MSRKRPHHASLPHSRRIGREVLVGLALTFLLLIPERLFEKTTPGKLWEGAVYAWLQTRLTGEETLPVAIVNISTLDPRPVPGKLTPREQITKVIDTVAAQGAAAIGIDVDFSPEDGSWTPRGGPQLFDHLLDLRTPVFLGVGRTRYELPDQWLGAADYRKLAAAISISAEDNRKMPLWIGAGSVESCLAADADLVGVRVSDKSAESTCLPSLGARLARRSRSREPHVAFWPRWFASPLEEEVIQKEEPITTAYFPVDYGPAATLRDQTSSAILSGDGVRLVLNPRLTSLEGKVVLLGNTDWEVTPDKYPIPPWQRETPGVYFHACATYTLIKGPLLEVTGAGRVVLDVFFASLVLTGMSFLQGSKHKKSEHVAADRLRFLLTWLAIVIVTFCGYALVQTTRVLWTDWLLVDVVLLFHSWVERHLERHEERLSELWHNVFFETRKGESL